MSMLIGCILMLRWWVLFISRVGLQKFTGSVPSSVYVKVVGLRYPS